MKTMKPIILCAALAAFSVALVGGGFYCGYCRRLAQSDDARLDVEMLALKTAYDNERKRINLAHAIASGGRLGYAMLGNSLEAMEEKYRRIANSRLRATVSRDEWRLIEEYAATCDELLVPRTRLLEKIGIWNRVRNAKGAFFGQNVCFTNGVAKYRDRSPSWAEWKDDDGEYGLPMEVCIDRKFVWTTHGIDYALAESDDKESASSSLRSTWFLRFKDGVLIDTCDLGNVYWDDEDEYLFCFEPRNECLRIMSVKEGELVKDLDLALRDRIYSTGERVHCFGTNEVPITDSAHDCRKISGIKELD